VVQSGQFPVNPLTMAYVSEELTARGLPSAGPVEQLTVLDLEELEGRQALRQRHGLTLAQLLEAWRNFAVRRRGVPQLPHLRVRRPGNRPAQGCPGSTQRIVRRHPAAPGRRQAPGDSSGGGCDRRLTGQAWRPSPLRNVDRGATLLES